MGAVCAQNGTPDSAGAETTAMPACSEIGGSPTLFDTPSAQMKRQRSQIKKLTVEFAAKKGDEPLMHFEVSQRVNAKIEKAIEEALSVVQEGFKADLRSKILEVASLAWHDRDAIIQQLEEDCQSVNKELTKVMAEEDGEIQNAQRMVVVSTNIPERELFSKAVKKKEWILEYDHESTTLAELSAAIEKKAKELKPRTIAFANHGANDTLNWLITKDFAINVEDVKPELSEEAKQFFKTLGAAADRRVDLLSCDLASTPGGLGLLKELEELTGKHFAASTNHTGNIKHGGDWVMETDNVDTSMIYFEPETLYKWSGILVGHVASSAHRGKKSGKALGGKSKKKSGSRKASKKELESSDSE